MKKGKKKKEKKEDCWPFGALRNSSSSPSSSSRFSARTPFQQLQQTKISFVQSSTWFRMIFIQTQEEINASRAFYYVAPTSLLCCIDYCVLSSYCYYCCCNNQWIMCAECRNKKLTIDTLVSYVSYHIHDGEKKEREEKTKENLSTSMKYLRQSRGRSPQKIPSFNLPHTQRTTKKNDDPNSSQAIVNFIGWRKS